MGISLIGDLDVRIHFRRLLKRERIKKIGCPYHGADALGGCGCNFRRLIVEIEWVDVVATLEGHRT